jgi:cell division protein FtsL
MPELGKPSKSKKSEEPQDETKVVSAYSEEGKARNAKRSSGLSRRFKILLIILYVLLFLAAMAIIYCAWKFSWF